MNNMNMDNILGQIDIIKRKLTELQEELKETTVSGNDKEKIVTALVSGTGKVLNYEFNPELMESIEGQTLVNSLVEATNDGLKKAKELEAQKKKEIVGDVNIPDDIPGLF